jgi:hypothetical protein
MQDEDIAYDADNPMTTEADWDGAVDENGRQSDWYCAWAW